MRIHVIVDFMHIYYKYFFQLREGRMKRLTAPIEWKGTVIEKDISLVYYPLRDIEGIRNKLEVAGNEVTMSICFDSPSHRKDEGVEGGDAYKATRKSSLSEVDFENIELIKKMLKEAGHNTYKMDGYEADDIVNKLVREFKDSFDITGIYTNDKDLLINVCDNVTVMRFKQKVGYFQVTKENYADYLEQEFKVYIPYNMLGLFLATAGDSSDGIKGIDKFGPKAFSKLLTKVVAKNHIDTTTCGDYGKLHEVVKLCAEFLTPEQYKQLEVAFGLVSNIEMFEIAPPTERSTQEKREQVYNKYKMISLIP